MSGMTARSLLGPLWPGLAACLLAWASTVQAASLQCQVTYAGTTHNVVADPVQDPYPVPSVNIGGRFRFKPVVVGTPQRIDRVLIYAYLVDGTQDLLIHQAKFSAPFATSAQPLTGQQFLYAGPLERELMYSCRWQGGTP